MEENRVALVDIFLNDVHFCKGLSYFVIISAFIRLSDCFDLQENNQKSNLKSGGGAAIDSRVNCRRRLRVESVYQLLFANCVQI